MTILELGTAIKIIASSIIIGGIGLIFLDLNIIFIEKTKEVDEDDDEPK